MKPLLRKGFFLFFDVSALRGSHVGGSLFKYILLDHVYTGSTEGITEPGTVGYTSLVKSVFWKALYTVFGIVWPGFISLSIPGTFYGFKREKCVIKTLESLSQTTPGIGIPLAAKLEFLFYKSFFHK